MTPYARHNLFTTPSIQHVSYTNEVISSAFHPTMSDKATLSTPHHTMSNKATPSLPHPTMSDSARSESILSVIWNNKEQHVTYGTNT